MISQSAVTEWGAKGEANRNATHCENGDDLRSFEYRTRHLSYLLSALSDDEWMICKIATECVIIPDCAYTYGVFPWKTHFYLPERSRVAPSWPHCTS